MTVEDTTGRFHASHGQVEPASEQLLSEPKIVARAGEGDPAAQSRSSTGTRGQATTRCVRDAIAETYPAIFANFNERIRDPERLRPAVAGARAHVEDAERQGEFHLAEEPVGGSRSAATCARAC